MLLHEVMKELKGEGRLQRAWQLRLYQDHYIMGPAQGMPSWEASDPQGDSRSGVPPLQNIRG